MMIWILVALSLTFKMTFGKIRVTKERENSLHETGKNMSKGAVLKDVFIEDFRNCLWWIKCKISYELLSLCLFSEVLCKRLELFLTAFAINKNLEAANLFRIGSSYLAFWLMSWHVLVVSTKGESICWIFFLHNRNRRLRPKGVKFLRRDYFHSIKQITTSYAQLERLSVCHRLNALYSDCKRKNKLLK